MPPRLVLGIRIIDETVSNHTEDIINTHVNHSFRLIKTENVKHIKG